MTPAKIGGDLGKDRLPILEVLSLHQRRPDVAGVIDVAIDLAGTQRIELDGLAHALALFDGEAGRLQMTF